jgi:hypothetical protein
MGYGDQTNILRNRQRVLHRKDAARVIGHGGCCHSERYHCDDRHDVFSHGLLLVQSNLTAAPHNQRDMAEKPFEARSVPIFELTRLRKSSAVAAIC